MIYPRDFEEKIGFDSVRKMLIEKCSSSMAKEEVLEMSFSCDYKEILHRLKSTDEMVSILEMDLPLPLENLYDIKPYISEIKAVSGYMSSEKLFRLMQMLETVYKINVFFNQSEGESNDKKFPELALDFSNLVSFPEIIREISRCVNKYGEIKDNASPRLLEIRGEIRREQGSMQRAMRRVIEKAVSQGVIDKDASASIRDGRLVLPVSAANKRAVSGIIHDESATGKTVFIEPFEVVEASNRLRELEIEENREIISILIGLADIIRPYSAELVESCNALGRIDFIRAKALFAIDMNASMPHLSDSVELEWYHALHPGLIVSLRQQGRDPVALDILLDKSHRILIISGPNAGGKSVCLKTLAVVQYMMQCGLLPTLYSNSHMGIFNNLFIDIGDEQSFENDLSTYSSHLKNMKFFLSHVNSHTLLLADEMGSGTEPQIGGAMAQSILQSLGRSGCYGVVTTHYQNLKSFADSEEGFVNGAMLYDRQHLQPTFQLSIGTPGSSFALDIASKIGLPKDVIARAKDIAGSEMVNIDKYLSEITRDKRYWANKRLNIKEKEGRLSNLVDDYETSVDDLRRQRDAILKDARKEAKEILDGVNAKIERTILEIRNIQAEKERTKKLREELKEYGRNLEKESGKDSDISGIRVPGKVKKQYKKKTLENSKSDTPNNNSFSVGDYVKMEGGGVTGKIISVNGRKCEIAFGQLRTIVSLDKLKKSSKPRETLSSQVSTLTRDSEKQSRERQLSFSTELDVRGMRGDEAVQALNYFMDDAVQFSASRVRILHGTGHGILKSLLREQLRINPNVKDYHDEDVRFGGAGITVVELD